MIPMVKLESFETRPIVLQTFYEPIEEEKILYLLPLGENNLLKIQYLDLTKYTL